VRELGFYLALVPIAAIAGFIRGFAGFGGPLVMLPALNFFLAPAASIPVMMCVDLLVNVKLLPEANRDASASVVLPLFLGTLVAMPLGVVLLVIVDPVALKRGISAAILLAALILLTGWRYQGATGTGTWTLVGLLTGVIMGATSLAVTAALFLNTGSQTAKQSRANFIVWVFLATLALLAMVAIGTGFDTNLIRIIAVLAPLYFLGTLLGSRLSRHAPEAFVRRAVLALIVIIATVGLVL
jgi:uncharacterized protein